MKIVAFWQGYELNPQHVPLFPGWSLLGSVGPETYGPGGSWPTFYGLDSVVADTEGMNFALGADSNRLVALGFFSARTSVPAAHPLWQFVESGTIHVTVQAESDGGFTVRRGTSTGTVLVTVPGSAVTAAPWVHHWQIVVDVHDTTGKVHVYKDGAATPTYSFAGDTRNGGTAGTVDTLRLAGISTTTAAWLFGHIYLTSGISGTEPENMGLCRVHINQAAMGTGTNTAWTGTSGDLDDWDSSNGITSSVNGQLESVVEGDLPDLGYPGRVKCVRVSTMAQDLGVPGEGQIEVGLIRGATAAYAAPFQPAITASSYAFMFLSDPATGAAWSAGQAGRTEFNGCEVIYRSKLI